MSNPDSFVNEVTEEVRRDRLFGLFKKYGWIGVLLVLLLVGGAAVNEWRKAQARAEAEAFGDAVVAALEIDDRAARAEALAGMDADGGRAAVLRLLTAAEAVNAGEPDVALAALAELEADADLPDSYRQLAALKRVIIGGSEIAMEERERVLSRLAQPGEAYRPLAMEQLALLRIENGEHETALGILEDLVTDSEATSGLRRRASQLMVVLGGDPATG